MIAAPLLALALAQAPEPALQIELERGPAGTVLRLRGFAGASGADVRRDGSTIRVGLPGAGAGLLVPPALTPLEELRLVSAGSRLELRLVCDPGVALELRRGPDELVLTFSEKPVPGAARADIPALYRSLFPAGLLSEPEQKPAEPPPTEEAGRAEVEGGLSLGPLSVRPSLLVSYVDGQNTLESTQPVDDRYLQIEPRLGLNATLQLLGGRLRVSYDPVFRNGSAFALTREPTHELDADLQQPLGAALSLRGNVHYTRGVLETDEVDPGREYFYGLSQFERWRYTAGARFETGGRFDLDLSGSLNQVRFQEPGYFYDFDDRALVGELGYDLTPTVRAGFGYVWSEVPAASVPERIQAASRSRALRLVLSGQAAEFQGELSAAYETREHPGAAPQGQSYRGLVAGARLSREFRPGATLGLNLSRFTTLSAFEDNGFYLANLGELVLSLPLPAGLSLRGGVGLQGNRYATPAAALGSPRHDTLRGWTVGLGRAFSRWAYARVDYRADRRDSNLDEFDNRTHTFIAQIGVGWLGGTGAGGR